MYFPVSEIVPVKYLLLLIGKSSPCSGGSEFPVSRLSEGL